MPKSLTEQLVERCAGPVQHEVRTRAARHLLDWLGCALIGSTSPAGRALAHNTRSYPSAPGRCLAIGTRLQGADSAAFLNGGLGNIFEMDDVHRASILHAGDVVVPAALAAAQEHGASSAHLLDAIVGGYEVALRIGTAAAAIGYSAWYNSGTCGVFGSAYAAARVMRLPSDRIADALGQAGMLASGIWQCRLEATFSKQLATARSAQSGLLAARLAATGFPGPRQVLEGELGFFAAYYPAADADLVLTEMASRWLIDQVSFKPWSACRHAHPAIEAAIAAGEQSSFAEIERIGVSTYAAAISFCDNPEPSSDHEARFSLQHCVAVAALKGEPQLGDFEEKRRGNPEISSLRKRIDLEENLSMTREFPSKMGSLVTIKLRDGRSIKHHVSTAKGDPENPMSDNELNAKFLRLAAASGVRSDCAQAVMDAILSLPDVKGLKELNSVLGRLALELEPTERT